MRRRRNPDNREVLTYAGLGALGLFAGGCFVADGAGFDERVRAGVAGAALLPVTVAALRHKGRDAGTAAIAGLGGALAIGVVASAVHRAKQPAITDGAQPCG